MLTFLKSKSLRLLESANEAVFQTICEFHLPSRHRVPELCLVMDGNVQKGDGQFGFLDIFVPKEVEESEECDTCLELKYVQIGNLVLDKQESMLSLKQLDEVIAEKTLQRKYLYWSNVDRRSSSRNVEI